MSSSSRWSLHLALVAALGSFVVARDDRSALLLFVPLAVAPALSWRRAPRRLVRGVSTLAHALAIAAFLVAVLAGPLVAVGEDVAFAWAGGLGWALAVAGVVLALGPGFWPPGTTLVPVVVGLLLLSALSSGVGLFTWFAGAAALALWLFACTDGGPRRAGGRLAAFAVTGMLASVGISRLLPWAQPRIEQAVAASMGDGTGGLAERSRLGEFARLARSRKVVLRVWASRPQRLRGFVLTRFDGREWIPSLPGTGAMARPVLPLAESGSTAASRVLAGTPGSLFLLAPGESLPTVEDVVEGRVVLAAGDWPILLPARTILVRASVPLLEPTGGGGLRWPRPEAARRYRFAARLSPGGRGSALSAAERAEALALPAVDPRLRIQARVLADGTAGVRARVEKTVDWLRSGFAYSLETGAFEADDPVSEFLFEKKRGYCSYFASAAAVLLRLQGVPTRFVKGFAVGPGNRVGDHYLVREQDAHAWIEAWIPGEGWVEADPTPPEGPAALGEAPGPLERALESVRTRVALLGAGFADGGVRGVLEEAGDQGLGALGAVRRHPLAIAMAACVLGAGMLLGHVRGLAARLVGRWRTRRRRASALPPGLHRLLRLMERHWARQGQPRPSTRGLREHLEALPGDTLSPRARDVSARVVDAVYRAAFSGRPVPDAEIDSLGRDVAGLS